MKTEQTAGDPVDDNTEYSADKILDCVGDLCPMPIYKASMAMKTIGDGQIMKVICSDPGSVRDFPAFAKQGGHAILRADHLNGVQVFYIQKRGQS